MPKDKEPMKSFLLVRSQSQISTDNRLSLSASFSWLQDTKGHGLVPSWQLFPHRVPPVLHKDTGAEGKGRSPRPIEVSNI